MMESLPSIPAVTICLAIFVLLMVLQFAEKIPVIGRAISLRWTTVSVILMSLIAVLIDFTHLSDAVRETVVVGSLVIAVVWIILRSIELWLYRGYFMKAERIELDGDEKRVIIEAPSIGKKKEEPKDESKKEEPKDEPKEEGASHE